MIREISTVLIVAVSGCAANGVPTIMDDKPAAIARRTRKMFFGIPVLAGLEGSYAVLDNRWAVTVAHNEAILRATFKEAYYHPECDLALFRIDDGEEVELGLVYEGGKVKHSGYPIGLPLALNEGEFIGDVIVDKHPNCVMSMSTGSVMSAMSGGGVWNDKNELIGVNVGIGYTDKHDNITIWQSLYGQKDWIESVTGKDYWK